MGEIWECLTCYTLRRDCCEILSNTCQRFVEFAVVDVKHTTTYELDRISRVFREEYESKQTLNKKDMYESLNKLFNETNLNQQDPELCNGSVAFILRMFRMLSEHEKKSNNDQLSISGFVLKRIVVLTAVEFVRVNFLPDQFRRTKITYQGYQLDSDERGMCVPFASLSYYNCVLKHRLNATVIRKYLNSADKLYGLHGISFQEFCEWQRKHKTHEDEAEESLYKSHFFKWLWEAGYVFHPYSDSYKLGVITNSYRLLRILYYGGLLGAFYSIGASISILTLDSLATFSAWISLIVGATNVFLMKYENMLRRKRNRELIRISRDYDERLDHVAYLNGITEGFMGLTTGMDKILYDDGNNYIRFESQLRLTQYVIVFISFVFNIIAAGVLYENTKHSHNFTGLVVIMAIYYTLMFVYKLYQILLLFLRVILNGKMDIRTKRQKLNNVEPWICASPEDAYEETPAVGSVMEHEGLKTTIYSIANGVFTITHLCDYTKMSPEERAERFEATRILNVFKYGNKNELDQLSANDETLLIGKVLKYAEVDELVVLIQHNVARHSKNKQEFANKKGLEKLGKLKLCMILQMQTLIIAFQSSIDEYPSEEIEGYITEYGGNSAGIAKNDKISLRKRLFEVFDQFKLQCENQSNEGKSDSTDINHKDISLII